MVLSPTIFMFLSPESASPVAIDVLQNRGKLNIEELPKLIAKIHCLVHKKNKSQSVHCRTASSKERDPNVEIAEFGWVSGEDCKDGRKLSHYRCVSDLITSGLNKWAFQFANLVAH